MKFKKICPICNSEFETNSPQKIYCNNVHYLPCPVCGKLVEKKDNDFSRSPKCCSSKCAHELRKQSIEKKKCEFCGELFLPKSGVSTICDKQHYQICVICGKSFPVSKKEIHDKVNTCSLECRKKRTELSNLEKYGTKHPMQNKDVQEHFKASMKEKYGVEHALQKHELSEKQQKSAYLTNMEHNGVPYACLLPQCIDAQGKIVSEVNRKIGNMIGDIGLSYSFEKRIGSFSYDICIEGIKTLIEIDPTYTHSTITNHWNQCRDKNYHLAKSKKASESGYRCIHIFDWDDINKIVDSMIPRKSIYARNCEIYRLNHDVAVEFLEKYHFQGSCRGQLLCLGLVNQGEIYQVMTFGKSRYDSHHKIELLRLCTKPGYTVVGGASRLFKFATECYGVEDIISYCDLSKFNGDVYKTLGMKLIRQTAPQEIWSKGHKKITANLLRQRGYDQLFNTNYGKGYSNEELMIKNGWLPIYDCGQAVYQY